MKKLLRIMDKLCCITTPVRVFKIAIFEGIEYCLGMKQYRNTKQKKQERSCHDQVTEYER